MDKCEFFRTAAVACGALFSFLICLPQSQSPININPMDPTGSLLGLLVCSVLPALGPVGSFCLREHAELSGALSADNSGITLLCLFPGTEEDLLWHHQQDKNSGKLHTFLFSLRSWMNCFSFRGPGRVKSPSETHRAKNYRATACIPLFKVKTPLASLQRCFQRCSHLEKDRVWNINAFRRSLSTPSQELALGSLCPFSVPTVHQAKLPAVFGPF